MEFWSERSRRINGLLWSVSLAFATAAAALISWLLTSIVLEENLRCGYVYIVILCLPLPYLAVYLLSRRRRLSPIGRRKLKRRLSEVTPDAPPRARALMVWDFLPFRGRLSLSGLSASLAPGKDHGWRRLAEANSDARLAAGTSFEILVLLRSGPFNFLSGELPGAGAWLAVSRQLLEGLDREELVAAIVHELFHRQTGELGARRIALRLYDLGLFATSFVIYYLAFTLVIASLPTLWTAPQLPLFLLLILLLWLAIKAFAYWAVFGLFPNASCVAADGYAGKTLARPPAVAGAILKSLAHSALNSSSGNLLSGQAYAVSRFMFVPLRRGSRGKEGVVERLRALRIETPDGLAVLPGVEKMNREIEEMTDKAARIYDGLLADAPSRLPTVLAYVFVIGLIVGIMGISTGKNFLPVRWFIDTFSGGPNVAVSGPSPSGETVVISGDGGEADVYYSPVEVTVKVGETVTWVNGDDVGHRVGGGDIPSSPLLGPGESYSVEFNRSGDYGYRVLDRAENVCPGGYVYACY